MYKEIFSFSELSNYKDHIKPNASIFFFDVQGVIIRNNNFHEALNSRKYEERLKSLCAKQHEDYIKIAKYGRFFKSKLTEEILPEFLSDLKKAQVELCLLTFARYSVDREKALKNHKVLNYFYKQIWAGGIDKGILMVEYLKTRFPDPAQMEQIYFMDDKQEHLYAVKKALDEYLSTFKETKITYELILYKKCPVTPVSEYDFERFWKTVIDNYKRYKIRKSVKL